MFKRRFPGMLAVILIICMTMTFSSVTVFADDEEDLYNSNDNTGGSFENTVNLNEDGTAVEDVATSDNNEATPTDTTGSSASEEEAIPEWDSTNWVRILRDYTDYTQAGKYYYYYSNEPNTSTYKVYRQDVKTGKTKLVLKLKANDTPEFYTNGKKLVYLDDNLGSIVKVKDLSTGKTKRILNLPKFKTSKSTDTVLNMYLYGNNLYYSKYRGLGTMIYKLYRVNINTGKQKTLKSGYILDGTQDQRFAGSRYVPVRDKKGVLRIYDVKKNKYKKLGTKTIRKLNLIDGYWYYTVCSNPSAKTKKYTIYKRVQSLSKKAKKVASFSCKYHYDDIMEFTDKHIIFLAGEKSSKEYRYAKKKFYTRKDMDVWYWIGLNQRYL